MKKITTGYIKKIIGGGNAKQLFAIKGLLDLNEVELEKKIKEGQKVLEEKEANEIEKIKIKFATEKSEIENTILSKTIKEIVSKNKIVIAKKVDEAEAESEEVLEEKVIENFEEKISINELNENDKNMEEMFEDGQKSFQDSWNHN